MGKKRIVLDLSCRKRGDSYYIVTDRWQRFTDVKPDTELLEMLSAHCSEFLVHGVDAEGRSSGMKRDWYRYSENGREFPLLMPEGLGFSRNWNGFGNLETDSLTLQ